MLDTAIVAQLKSCSSATLTTQLFKRGLRNAFMQGVQPLTKLKTPMVGEAFTLRYIPAREDLDHVGVFADPEHPQRKAIETTPPGQVLVCDCRRDARAASGGSILLTRLKVRGVAGFVSDGGLRDSPEIAGFDLPVYCGGPAAPLNLVHHHAVDNRPGAAGLVVVGPSLDAHTGRLTGAGKAVCCRQDPILRDDRATAQRALDVERHLPGVLLDVGLLAADDAAWVLARLLRPDRPDRRSSKHG